MNSKLPLRPGPVSMGPPASHGPGLDSCQALLHSLTVSRHADTLTYAPEGNFACNQRVKVGIYFDQRAPGVPTCREACIGLRTHVSSGAAASDGPSGSQKHVPAAPVPYVGARASKIRYFTWYESAGRQEQARRDSETLPIPAGDGRKWGNRWWEYGTTFSETPSPAP